MKLFYCYDTVINIIGMASPTTTPKEDGSGNFGEFHYISRNNTGNIYVLWTCIYN